MDLIQAEEEQDSTDEISVRKSVYRKLEAVRPSGAVNRFGDASVLWMTTMWNNKEAASWLHDHKRAYRQGALYGIVPEE